MDLNALLAKRSTAANSTTGTQHSAKAVEGFADALTSAFGNALPTDTFSALDQMVANRSARRDTIESVRERPEAPERKSKDDVRKAERSEAHDDAPKTRDDDKVEREQPEEHADAADANTQQPKADKADASDETAQSSATASTDTDTEEASETEQVATASPEQSATDAATEELYVATGLLASDANADGTTEAQGAKTADPLAAATENAAKAQQQAGQQTTQTNAAQQNTQQATVQQGQQQAAATTDANAPAQQAEGEAEADPLAKIQAQGIAQKLDKSENVSIAVTKTQQPQQANQAQQSAQNTSADKPLTATQTQTQTAVTDVDANLDGNANSNAQQNLNAGNQPKEPLPGTQQGGVAAANSNGPSVFQQAMAAQGGQAAQAAQASQAGQNAQQVASGSTASQATSAVEGTSSTTSTTSTTGQPTAAPLASDKGAGHTQTAQSAKAAVPKTPVPPKQVVDQVKVSIAQAAKDGADKINIRLRPTELGRVDVKLEINNDGSVRAMVIADRPETLDVLRRDSAGLDRALQDAGLKTDQESLNFSLRDQQGGQNGNSMAQNEGRSQNPYGSMAPDQDELDLMEESLAAYANTGSADGVDIRV